MLSALEKLGFSSFRPGQQEAVMRVLCGEFLVFCGILLMSVEVQTKIQWRLLDTTVHIYYILMGCFLA